MNNDIQFEDPDFGICRILYNNESMYPNTCLFASHSAMPVLSEYVYYYLRDIKKTDIRVLFICASTLAEDDVIKLSSIVDVIIEKENKGTDFGSWASVLRWLGPETEAETLFLCNDSVFGPFIPFTEIYERFIGTPHEILGMTDSFQSGKYHIQSYFIGLKSKVLQSDYWKDFWANMTFHSDKRKVIDLYEIGLTGQLQKGGFELFIWSDWKQKIGFSALMLKMVESTMFRERWLKKILSEREKTILDINPSSLIWKELITECQHPFIKRELFIKEHLYDEDEIEKDWEKVLRKHTSYPIHLLKSFLTQFHFFNSWKLTGLTNPIKISIPEGWDLPEYTINDYHLFRELVPILDKPVPADNPSIIPYETILAELTAAHIDYLPLIISEQEVTSEKFICNLLYIEAAILLHEKPLLDEIKRLLKEIPWPVIITPDEGVKAIVSHLLKIKSDTILVEKDFLQPVSPHSLIKELNEKLYLAEGPGSGRHLFSRSSLSDVITDALNGTNQTGFLCPAKPAVQVISPMTENDSELRSFELIREKYILLYENTPIWYKKIGQAIKLLMGKKRIGLRIRDKGQKEIYHRTAEDISHWYYIQYEVLPKWYKQFGKKLTRKKDKNG